MDILYFVIEKINSVIWGMPVVLLIMGTSLYFTYILYLNGKKKSRKTNNCNDIKVKGNSINKITNFRSLTSVLAGTLGTGNITGIAVAIITGGIGSLFWMFIAGLCLIVISYVENYIVLSYRKKTKTGYYGGTMYVLDEVLDKKYLAIAFAIIVIISMLLSGTMTQANSLTELINSSSNLPKEIVGIILVLVTIYIICGGKHRIAKLSSVVIPACSLMYILLCTVVLITNANNILPAIGEVIRCAFGKRSIVGGTIGIGVTEMIAKGFSLGMFSNEAGMGTTPMFTANVDDNDIHKSAKVASMSVVIDTLFLCMLTGITIISTGKYNIQDSGMMLTEVFKTVPLGAGILNFCMIFFVLSTIPCLEYYLEQAICYLTKRRIVLYIFRVLYVVGIYLGSMVSANLVWDLSSILSVIMAIPNLYMMYCLIDDVAERRKRGI